MGNVSKPRALAWRPVVTILIGSIECWRQTAQQVMIQRPAGSGRRSRPGGSLASSPDGQTREIKETFHIVGQVNM